jgi:cytochrome d ubiquinol oxidase subunit I
MELPFMETLFLMRIQFAISIGLHYLFPIANLGLALMIVIFQSLAYFKKSNDYDRIAAYLIKFFTPIFAVGVATGFFMPFLFGTGWSKFSIFSGEIFGSFLAIESIVAFTMESVFLAILIFGKKKVSPKMYLISVFVVFIGSHLSSFFIVAANSWLQTPAGYSLEAGHLEIVSMTAALFNPSTMVRFVHVTIATWIAGSIISAAIAGAYLVKKHEVEIVKKMLSISMIVFSITTVAELLVGHEHIMNVLHHQPVKSAAYEGVYKTEKGVGLYLFGLPDNEEQVVKFGIKIPYLLSFLESYRFDAEVEGLDKFPKELWPPVPVIFTTFHIMVGAGFIMIGTGFVGIFLLLRKKLFTTTWYLRALAFIVPFPFIASEAGWMGTEIGRQPWLIYNVMKTADGVSPNATSSGALLTMTVLCIVYILLVIPLIFIIRKSLKKGFEPQVTTKG